MLTNPGEFILVEDPTYTGTLLFLETVECDLSPIATDENGIIPKSLEDMLTNWPESNQTCKKDQPRLHILYTVPTRGNFTGCTSAFERKNQVYDICSKYDVVIVEDDPCYYLQLDGDRIRFYLSIDTDTRVLRLDSMSKIISSGMCVGWVTGPIELVGCINMHTMVINLQPVGLPQCVMYETFKTWGYKKFFEHVNRVADFYREKRDQFAKRLDQRMKGRATWFVPNVGKFVWIHLFGGITDSYDLVMNKTLKENILAIPGISFMPQRNVNNFIRVSYSNVSYEQMDEALRILAKIIDEEAASKGIKIEA